MAHGKSARKRVRQNETARERNKAQMNALRSELKKARTAIAAGSADDAQLHVKAAERALDKAVSKGLIHRNNADRHKARLAKRLRNLAQPTSA